MSDTAPAPAKAGLPDWAKVALVVVVALSVQLAGLVLVAEHLGLGPVPAPASADGAKLGKAFAPKLAESYADAFEALAAAVDAGKEPDDALTAFDSTWREHRAVAYRSAIQPAVNAIIPEGTPKFTGPAQRAALAKFARDMAKGLRGGK